MYRKYRRYIADIDISHRIGTFDIVFLTYRYRIDIGHGDIDPLLLYTTAMSCLSLRSSVRSFVCSQRVPIGH